MKFLRLFEDFETAEKEKSNSQFDDIKSDLKQMIEKSLKTSDQKTLQGFISAFSKDPEKNQIEGLINDSDVYEFYLKYRNDIDQILSDEEFYNKKPSELDSFSLYDYTISGTKEAIKQLVGKIVSEE